MSLTCYIIDDEPLAIEVLENHAEQYGGLDVIETFQNAVNAFQALSRRSVDVIFLDIEMPKLTGLDLLRSLRKQPRVIITTAHRNYAVEGFELDVTDYLVKPIAFERFLAAMGKVERQYPGLVEQQADSLAGGERRDIVVRVDKKNVRVPLSDILYVESRRDYIHIVMGDEVIRTPYRIGKLADELSSAGFIRIHRSFLVPVERIDAWSSSQVEIGNKTLPIGRTYRKEVGRELDSNDR